MIRHPRLQALSRDHHRALVLAKRAARAAAASEQEQREMCRQLASAFADELEPHFVIEERDLPALLNDSAGQPLLAQFAAEHATLRRLAAALADQQCAMLPDFASALAEHVRFEERILFPAIEQVLARDSATPR